MLLISKNKLNELSYLALVSLIVLVIEYYINSLNLVKHDDLVAYENYFNISKDLDFTSFLVLDSREFYGSLDYGFNILTYISSGIFSFSGFLVIVYLMYSLAVAKLFYNNSLWFLGLIFPFTFYGYGVSHSAVRLTLAMTVFIVAFNARKKIYSFIAPLFHSQVIPLFLFFRISKNKLLFLILGLIAVLFSPSFFAKLNHYFSNNNIDFLSFYKSIALFAYFSIVVYISTKENYIFFILLLFIILLSIIGPGRIEILFYMLSLLLINNKDRPHSYSIIMLSFFSTYDFLKGVLFLNDIINDGNGYGGFN